MKINNVFVAILIALLFSSCTEKIKEEKPIKPSFTINGTVNNFDATKAYLYKQDILQDSAVIENNNFKFLGTADTIQFYSVQFKNSDIIVKTLIENASYNLYASPYTQFIYGGSAQNELNNYTEGLQVLIAKKFTYLDSIGSSNSTDLLHSIDSLNNVIYVYNLTEIKKTNLTPITNIIFDNLLINSSLDTIKLNELVAFAESIDNNEWLTKFNSKLEEIAAAELKFNEERIAANKKRVVKRRLAPSFSGLSINGTNLSLQSVLNGKKAVLIDFWASWCAPCREASPKIRYLYQKYKNKGFDVITVSEDKNQNDWRNGITEDNMLAWNHIYDENMRIANKFYVGAIPHMVLIDQNGGIIVNKISVYRLEDELKNIFK